MDESEREYSKVLVLIRWYSGWKISKKSTIYMYWMVVRSMSNQYVRDGVITLCTVFHRELTFEAYRNRV